ncbi:energy transducer TonB [Paraburkholderia caribensis]|uniref:energy transducer TonB n=1 Tax=Paraburkholderia caribensis TaxID=75105 RepID=UPI00072293CB|nr:energy transducer TonB [Paraburkholderia caribensis]ALP68496.1 hypothetical protein AN416_37825 [Paraburkholderia caribensis]AUT57850.1 energy transducer TonB [Paraburkholderia caribensis]
MKTYYGRQSEPDRGESDKPRTLLMIPRPEHMAAAKQVGIARHEATQTRSLWRRVTALLVALSMHVVAIYFVTAQRVNVGLSSRGGGNSTPISVSLIAPPAPPAPPVVAPKSIAKPKHDTAPKILATRRASVHTVLEHDSERLTTPLAAPPQTTPEAVPATSAQTIQVAHSTPSNAGPDDSKFLNLPKTIGDAALRELACRIPSPNYPARAKRLGESGIVRLRIQIGTDGRLSGVSVARSSGFPELDAAALDAVSGGVCEPFRQNGVPVVVTAEQPVGFDLDH